MGLQEVYGKYLFVPLNFSMNLKLLLKIKSFFKVILRGKWRIFYIGSLCRENHVDKGIRARNHKEVLEKQRIV